MDTEELAHLTELRKIYVKKLRVLEQQEANFGNYSPPHIITEIKDIRIKIEELDYKTRIIMNSTFQYIVQSQERMESKSTQGNALKIQDAPKFEVILTDVGSTRMRVVKAICETVNLELHEARELTFDANSLILDTVSKEEAERIKRRLEEAGAKVEINPQRLKHLTIEQLRTKSLFTVVLRESGFNKSAITHLTQPRER